MSPKLSRFWWLWQHAGVSQHVPAASDRLLVTIADAASVLSVSRRQVYRLIGEGRLLSVRVGRRRLIPFAALEEFVQRLELTECAKAPH
jgi:excisionase family DNA binding protein